MQEPDTFVVGEELTFDDEEESSSKIFEDQVIDLPPPVEFEPMVRETGSKDSEEDDGDVS